eukprot:SAG11_NODE_3708_length_2267_cov_1.899908_2_plen_212_part_00
MPKILGQGYQNADVTCAYMSMEPSAGSVAPLPPVVSDAALAVRWQHYLQSESRLSPADFGASSWPEVLPAGNPAFAGLGNVTLLDIPLPLRRRYYWTTRFIAWDGTIAHSLASAALQAAWATPETPGSPAAPAQPNGTGADLFVYTNFNNWPGRYFMPRLSDNTSQVDFDWHEFGRLRGSSLVWTEDWYSLFFSIHLKCTFSIFSCPQSDC